MSVPAGFERHFRQSNVTNPWEPIYSRRDAGAIVLGLTLSEAHCNSRGLVHGGVIATLADNAMGLSYLHVARQQLGEEAMQGRGAVTVNLAVDYVAAAKIGQWLQITPRVVRAGKNTGFVDVLVTAGDDIIARANATFRVV